MLVLTRKRMESVNIYVAGVRVRVVCLGKAGHDRQKWGIEAPQEVRILRDEIDDRNADDREDAK